MNLAKTILIIVLVLNISLGANNDRALKMMKTEQRVALVIGNNQYSSDRLASLKNPINDAKAMRTKLQNLGFKVYYGENMSVKQMDKKLRTFSSKLRGGGVGLFFFAGHGVESNGQNYLMGKDSNLLDKEDIAYESLELNKVLDKMKNSGNRLNIVLLDACRNDPFSRSGGGGLAKVDNARGMFIAYATSPGDVASDGRGKHGVFTQEILNNIDAKGMSLHNVFKNIKRDVYNKTDHTQRPWTHDDIIGNFFFRLPSESLKAYNTKSSYNFKNTKPKVPTHFDLTVNTTPSDARVYITNIKPKYYDGIKLKKGTYNIKVKRSGYLTKEGVIELSSSANIDVVLEKEKQVYGFKSKKRVTNPRNVTIIDGLMWQDEKYTKEEAAAYARSSHGKVLDWKSAKNYCKNLTLAGYVDWRLPQKETLKKLYENRNKLKYFSSSRYWSSTTYESPMNCAWVVDFYGGDVYNGGPKGDNYYVRCIRDGQ